MASHLLLKHNTYYARLDIPKDVREQFGRREFKQSLKTGNKQTALVRVGPVVAAWKQQISNARGGGSIAEEAAIWRQMRADAKDQQDRNMIDGLIGERAADIADSGRPVVGLVADDQPDTTESANARKFALLAKGKLTPITAHLDRWLSDQGVKAYTAAEYRRSVVKLSKHFEHVEDVSRRLASEYVARESSEGKSPDTVGKHLSALMGYWDWLSRHGYIGDDAKNPWHGLRPKKKSGSPRSTRRGFTDDEAAELLRRVKRTENKHPDDYTVLLTVAATGMRLEEVTSLKKDGIRVDADVVWLSISDSKTKSGVRRVPILDTRLRALLRARTAAQTENEFAFDRLTADEHGKRSRQVTKRIGRALREFADDPSLVAAHSWRHRAVTLLEQGEIPRSTADWFIGHARLGEGLRTYAAGPSDAQLIEAAQCISVPEHS